MMFKFHIEKVNHFIYSVSARQRKMARDSSQALHDIIVDVGVRALHFYDMENPRGIEGFQYHLIEPKDKRCSMYIAVLNGDCNMEFAEKICLLVNLSAQRGCGVTVTCYEGFLDEFTRLKRRLAREEQLAKSAA